jgi:hypothetical protein
MLFSPFASVLYIIWDLPITQVGFSLGLTENSMLSRFRSFRSNRLMYKKVLLAPAIELHDAGQYHLAHGVHKSSPDKTLLISQMQKVK